MNIIKRLGGVVALAALSVTAMASGAQASNINAYVKGQVGDKLVVVLVRDTTITYQIGGQTVNYPIKMAIVSVSDLQGHVIASTTTRNFSDRMAGSSVVTDLNVLTSNGPSSCEVAFTQSGNDVNVKLDIPNANVHVQGVPTSTPQLPASGTLMVN